jgi:hypothetical protein
MWENEGIQNKAAYHLSIEAYFQRAQVGDGFGQIGCTIYWIRVDLEK